MYRNNTFRPNLVLRTMYIKRGENFIFLGGGSLMFSPSRMKAARSSVIYSKGKTQNFMFCWPCILLQSLYITNLTHNYISFMFISILYMFRTAMCPSSGEVIVSIHLVYVTVCRWPSGKDIYTQWHLPDVALIQ